MMDDFSFSSLPHRVGRSVTGLTRSFVHDVSGHALAGELNSLGSTQKAVVRRASNTTLRSPQHADDVSDRRRRRGLDTLLRAERLGRHQDLAWDDFERPTQQQHHGVQDRNKTKNGVSGSLERTDSVDPEKQLRKDSRQMHHDHDKTQGHFTKANQLQPSDCSSDLDILDAAFERAMSAQAAARPAASSPEQAQELGSKLDDGGRQQAVQRVELVSAHLLGSDPRDRISQSYQGADLTPTDPFECSYSRFRAHHDDLRRRHEGLDVRRRQHASAHAPYGMARNAPIDESTQRNASGSSLLFSCPHTECHHRLENGAQYLTTDAGVEGLACVHTGCYQAFVEEAAWREHIASTHHGLADQVEQEGELEGAWEEMLSQSNAQKESLQNQSTLAHIHAESVELDAKAQQSMLPRHDNTNNNEPSHRHDQQVPNGRATLVIGEHRLQRPDHERTGCL